MGKLESQTGGVIVQIMGEEYRIATQRGFDEVQRIAAYVDEKTREIAAQHAGHVPRTTLAVLAAMEIAGELLGARSEQSQLAQTAQHNLERLSRLIDARAGIPSALLDRAGRTGSRPAVEDPRTTASR
jgi:cell division protein ZapA (FtsZ GTPase activity inhibitor)